MLVIRANGSVLLDHLPEVLVDVVFRRQRHVRILYLILALLSCLLIRIQLEVFIKVMDCVYLLSIEHNGRYLSLRALSRAIRCVSVRCNSHGGCLPLFTGSL